MLPSVTFTTVCPSSGVAVARLRVGQGTLLVEPVEVGAGETARFTLLERATNPDVSVGQCEGGFGGVQCLQIQSAPAQLPRRDLVARVVHAHLSRSSARSFTTTSAPCSRSASA